MRELWEKETIVEDLESRAEELRAGLQGSISGPLAPLKAQAATDDSEHDRAHKLFYNLIKAVADHGRTEADRAAGKAVIDVLYPDGLVVTTASYEREVAAGATFTERLTRADIKTCFVAVEAYIPTIEAMAGEVVAAAEALGTTLKKIRALEIDKAGKPIETGLFDARREALKELPRTIWPKRLPLQQLPRSRRLRLPVRT